MALEDAKTQVDHAFTRTERRGLSFENAFGGATSFLRRRYSKDLSGVNFAVMGVPLEVSYLLGGRLGPLLQLSAQVADREMTVLKNLVEFLAWLIVD